MSTSPPGPRPGMQTVLPRRVWRGADTRALSDGIRSVKTMETKDERKVVWTLPPGGSGDTSPLRILAATAGTLGTPGQRGHPRIYHTGGIVLGLRAAARRCTFC